MRLHKPVLLEQAVELLNCEGSGVYVDCTLGMGGHAEKILETSSPGGFLLATDRDEEAIRYATERLATYKHRLKIVHEDYRMLTSILEANNIAPPNAILADLGPSLLQFTSAERGFSFQLNGPLDMRMDQRQQETAQQIVNTRSFSELTRILRDFGEEKSASRIGREILKERTKGPINTTEHLRQIVERSIRTRGKQKIHPATKTFQALRIAVNHELDGLDNFIFDAFDSLAFGGRLVIIAFHSLEDRIIKQAFQFLSAACRCPKRFVECRCGGQPLSLLVTKKPVRPEESEIDQNPASRSARLRAIEKLRGPSPREFWAEWLKEHE